MRTNIKGTYIECDGGTFKHKDRVRLAVDTDESVFLHLEEMHDEYGHHPGTIALSAEGAHSLAKELKKAARMARKPGR